MITVPVLVGGATGAGEGVEGTVGGSNETGGPNFPEQTVSWV